MALPEPTSAARPRVLGAIVATFAIVAVDAWQPRVTVPEPAEQIAAVARRAPPATVSPPLRPANPAPVNRSPVSAREAEPPRAKTPRSDAAAATAAPICGFGQVELAADDPYGLQRIPASIRNAALDEAEASMRANDDPQVRAAALLIGARRGNGGARTRTEALARLAAASQSAEVYAIALEACKPLAPEVAGSCALLSRAQSARLDPDNAHSWLELAAEARSRQDLATEDDAMRHATQARRSDTHPALLSNLVNQALGLDTRSLPRTLALEASWSAQAAWNSSHGDQVAAYCSDDAISQPDRRETCAALAEMLSQRGSSLEDMRLSLAIGKSLSWAAPRIQAIADEYDAISEAGGAESIGVDFSCEAVERVQAWMRQLGALGELQALRDALARSGRSVADWSAKFRRNFALAAATADAAALVTAEDATP